MKVLVVDDEPGMVDGIVRHLRAEGYHVEGTRDSEEAMRKLREGFDIVVTDLVMPGIGGMDILGEAKRVSPGTAVIMITGFATVESAVEAMKQGARDYITKPFDPGDLKAILRDVVEELEFEEEKKKGAREYPLEAGEVDRIIKALSNPLRRRSIEYLREAGESNFSNIWKALKVDDPTKLSFHLRVLKQAGLVDQHENRVYYLTESGRKAIELIEKF
ncbi:MAG: response regulator [Euryarchaeota archaeon]|nr:response regulator [Euryarchaeota archaeon]